MSNYKKLEHITNGFRAAHKINTIQSSAYRSNDDGSQNRLNPETLKEILHVIAEYSPDTYRESISQTLQQTSLYADTYRQLKQHLNQPKRKKTNSNDMLKLMSIVKPTLGGKNQRFIEKILKIFEILNS